LLRLRYQCNRPEQEKKKTATSVCEPDAAAFLWQSAQPTCADAALGIVDESVNASVAISEERRRCMVNSPGL